MNNLMVDPIRRTTKEKDRVEIDAVDLATASQKAENACLRVFPFIKWQNNPKYDNMSKIFHIFLTALVEGEVGSTQAVSQTAL